jgi:hypothetical protein
MAKEENMTTPIGVAILNKQNNLGSGGVASLGGSASFPFTTLDTLKEMAPLWVVSSPEKTFLTEGGATIPFLRHSGFLPTTSTALADELIQNAQEHHSDSAQVVSEILTRVVSIANSMAPLAHLLISRAGASAHARTLTSAIQQSMAPLLRADPLPKELVEALPSMFVAPGPLAGSSGNDLVIKIPANRVALANQVFSTPVPGYSWREVPLNEYPNPLSWAVGGGEPIIAKVSIKGALPKVRSSAPLMGHLTRGAVKWMALPEIASLSKIIEMRAEKVFVAENLVHASASLKVPPPVFSPTGHASISAGLFSEAYLHAACSPAHLQEGVTESGPKGLSHSIRAAWLLSSSRSHIVHEAMELSNAGFSVIGYGTSHVLVSVPAKNLKSLRKALSQSKLLSYPPGLRFHENAYQAYADDMAAKSVERIA